MLDVFAHFRYDSVTKAPDEVFFFKNEEGIERQGVVFRYTVTQGADF